MSHEIVNMDNTNISRSQKFTDDQVQLLKDTICRGSTDDEFKLFAYVCKHVGLDPFMKQIYPVKRWDSDLKREVMTFQTSIDGYRLIADRSGKYMPGREPTFTYDKDGRLFSATAYIKKLGPDGQWHEISSTAFFNEYAARKKDGTLTAMWQTKGHIMTAKCAEAAAIKKAFPSETAAVYTKEEMEQADNPIGTKPSNALLEISSQTDVLINAQQEQILTKLLEGDDEGMLQICKIAKIECLGKLPLGRYDKCLSWVKQRIADRQKAQEEPKVMTMDELLAAGESVPDEVVTSETT